MTFQNPHVFGSLTVAENVELGARAKQVTGALADRVSQALRRLGLAAKAQVPASALSVGQRKLMEFARALVGEPDVVLLDEPSAGVNPGLLTVLTTEFRVLSDRGASAIVVSHDLPWAFSVCSRIIVLASGRVLLEGPPDMVASDPRLIEAYLT